ncbi:helix-turn-helix domain-containing protein [Clostridium magnum]|uniref:helix-turn-helix domain-containing protein n=1 Tax=Clostridium magnum TaxID=33954 RepID=UPI000923CF5E|nr:helix-turn-helix transcriptional regulator [Clostridium magnum]SHJ13327.1 hypothetical protein SAMN02745944_05412 [Clostridium magnum DSM 2767]
MSDFDPVVHYDSRIEDVDFIDPERIREACRYRGYTYKEAAEKCEIEYREFGLMANGHKDVPTEYIFKLMKGLNFPKKFFYRIKWERV